MIDRAEVEKKRPVGSLPPSKPPTGPAPPRRSVCAPGRCRRHSIADQLRKGERTMSFLSWLQNLRSALAPRRGQRPHRRRGSLRAATYRPSLEVLEDRLTPSLTWAGNYPLSEFDLGGATPASTNSAT